jgi:hypothetical protein
MTILLGDFNTEVEREDIFILSIRNESFRGISNDNGVGVVDFAIIKKSNCHEYYVPPSQSS